MTKLTDLAEQIANKDAEFIANRKSELLERCEELLDNDMEIDLMPLQGEKVRKWRMVDGEWEEME